MAVLRYFHKPPNPRSDTTTQQISTINNTVSNIQSALEKKVTKSSGRGLSENNYSTPEKNKLYNIEDGAEVNVQADWNETDTTSDSYILNKPNVPILDPSGQIPAAYLPSYVDDVIEYNSVVDFPSIGEKGKIYVDASTDIAYRWSGSTYIEISKSIVTGVKGDAETDYRIGNINLTAANIGLSKVVNLDLSKAIKTITRSGTTFTYTCLDGTTGTFTLQDTVYSLPLAANGTRGGILLGFTQSGKNYPVQLSGEKAYVNVPWTDTWPTKLSLLTNDPGYITGITKAMVTTALGYTPPTTDHTYNFAGVSFTSGQSDTGEHNANNIASNGVWYYTSNGPATSLGASTNDGALYSLAYSTSWVGQIAQDYRNGRLFFRGRNNGTWTGWLANIDSGNISSQNVSYATNAGSATSATNASVLTYTGTNNGVVSAYQTADSFMGRSGWASYIICNHGDGATYYSQTIALPFWGPPIYRRLEGGIDRGWASFITSENIASYNAGSATKLQTARSLWGNNFDGSGDVNGTLYVTGVSNWCEGIRINNASNGWTTIILGASGASGTNANAWSFHTYVGNFYLNRNGSNGHTGYELCNVNGNWGFGTISPSYKLDVDGDVRATNFRGNLIGSVSGYLPLTGGTLTGQLTISNDKYISVTRTGRGITFGSGTDTYVGGDTTLMYVWQGKNLPVVFGTNGSERMRITNGGVVSIGHSTPPTAVKLYVNGNAYLEGSVSATICTSRSDLRLKDIQDKSKIINIEDIANAPIITFKWKNKDVDEDVHVGTSAQYWNEVLPEAVSVSFDNYLSMDYGATALSSAITVARKTVEHEEKIKQLEDENKQLKEELLLLKSQIKDILAVINSDNN